MGNSDVEIKNDDLKKYTSTCLNKIEEMSNFECIATKLNDNDISSIKFSVKREENGFWVESANEDDYKWFNNEHLLCVDSSFVKKGTNLFELENDGFIEFSFFSTNFKSGSDKNTIIPHINPNVISIGTSDNYFRTMLPIPEKYHFDFDLFEWEKIVINDNCFKNFGAFICNFCDIAFEVFIDKNYLIIDCDDIISEQEFLEKADCILEGVGFFTGYFIHDERFIFSSKDKSFNTISMYKYEKLTKSLEINTLISKESKLNDLIFPNRNVLRDDNRSCIRKDIFNKLMEKLYGKEEEKRILNNCLFVLFSAMTNSLDIQSICLSALLEGLRNYTEKTNSGIMSPRNYYQEEDEEKIKKFRKVFDCTCGYTNTEIDGFVKKIYEHHLSNDEQLQAPFKSFGLKLDADDIEAIHKRNTFLHGATPSFKLNNPSIKEEAKQLFCLAERQFALCYELMLKIVGYDGFIINYRKEISYYETGSPDNEECMIKI